MICDYSDLLERAIRQTMPANAQALSRAFLEQALKGAEVIDADDKFSSIREIAKSFGEEEFFNRCNKSLSKFVHPTALSIHFRMVPPEFAVAILSGIVTTGGSFVAKTFPVITRAIIEYQQGK
jgi:hypothetical protein